MPREGCGGTGQDVLQRVAEEADPRAGPAAPQNPPLRSPPPPPTAAKGGWSTEQGQPLVPPPRQRQGNHGQSFRATTRRVPTSARRPILRFQARGGGPNENTHQSLCKRGRRRASTPMRELVGGAKGRGLAPGFKLERPTVNDSLERERGRLVLLRDWESVVLSGRRGDDPTRGSGGGGW